MIGTVSPNAYIGCLANLDRRSKTWDIYATDPAEETMNEPPNNHQLDKFYKAYYEPFIELINKSGKPLFLSYGSKTYLATYLPTSVMNVGVDQDLKIFERNHQNP